MAKWNYFKLLPWDDVSLVLVAIVDVIVSIGTLVVVSCVDTSVVVFGIVVVGIWDVLPKMQ